MIFENQKEEGKSGWWVAVPETDTRFVTDNTKHWKTPEKFIHGSGGK